VSVNAAIPEGIDYPARLELIHVKTVTPVPEKSLNASSTPGLTCLRPATPTGRHCGPRPSTSAAEQFGDRCRLC
jgi:hypothetical protein